MTSRELREAQARYDKASTVADALRSARDDGIRALAREGHTHAAIYRILEGKITRARIGQITKE